jgi:hypothetical protein
MNSPPVKLGTITCAAWAREPVHRLRHEAGAHRSTRCTVEGDGHQGGRTADIQEFADIQNEVIVQPTAAAPLLPRLAPEFFPKFTLIADETAIRVLRREKF